MTDQRILRGMTAKAAMTALAGMAMLMEGSTLREGKYSNQIRRAVDWFVDRAQPNGLLANTRDPAERNHVQFCNGVANDGKSLLTNRAIRGNVVRRADIPLIDLTFWNKLVNIACPIALYPASSLSEKVSFNRINRKTGRASMIP